MTKRIVAAFLWAYAGLYLGAILSSVVGVDGPVGAVLALAAAVLFAGDPLHRIWTPRVSSKRIDSRLASISSRA